MAIDLIPLCTATYTMGDSFAVAPTHVVAEVLDGRLEGERLRATVKGRANADWLTVGPDGVGHLDVRVTLETDDGALVLMTYTGRIDLATLTAYGAPTFRTGDERYAWLNRIQAVAKGTFAPPVLTYEIHEVR
jgi:hypothetical protein